jgi:uncharacterized protein (TIGR03067 family)
MQEDTDRLQGTWSFASLEIDGVAVPAAGFAGSRMVIEGDTFAMLSPGADYRGTFVLDPSAIPKQLDIHFQEGPEAGNTAHGIYELEGNAWTICLGLTGKERPAEFATRPGSGSALEVLRRGEPVPAAEASAYAESAPRADDLEPELEALQGEWSAVSVVMNGQSLPASLLKSMKRVARGRELTVSMGAQVVLKAEIVRDPSHDPSWIDYRINGGPNAGSTQLGIYAREGDRLRSCMAESGLPRPEEFTAPAGSSRTLSEWKRETAS